MMKLYLLSVILLCAFSAYAQDTTKILFIGNSITYFNNMPQTFERIAHSKGDPTKVTMYAPGGTGFINHVNDPNVYRYFRQGDWDYVVLQPGSNESPGYSQSPAQTLSRARRLLDSIEVYNPCAKVLYYEISYGVWGNTAADLTTYNNTMDQIRINVTTWADSTYTFFAPAGEAMRAAWNNDPSTLLWGSNGDIHPNAKGSYLIACSFYASIFQKPSSGTPITGSLTAVEAAHYQQIADTTVLNHLSDWRINTYNQHTDFATHTQQLSTTFTSTSQNIDSLRWDFGDGDTSNTAVVTHQYRQAGMYWATLTTYNGPCTETVGAFINIAPLGLTSTPLALAPTVYPNPFDAHLTIEHSPPSEVHLFNTSGQSLSHLITVSYATNQIEIETTQLPSGLYWLKTNIFSTLLYKP